MRRLRETGIVTILLLGLTGCAGFEQRLGWTEPPYVGDEGTDERPLSRLAFWRRHRAEEANPADVAPAQAAPARSTMIAGGGDSSDDDEDRPGLLRRLPLVGRLLKAGDRDESDAMDVPLSRYTLAPSAGATGFVPPRTPAATTTFVPPGTPAGEAKPAATPATASETAALPPQPAASEEEPLRELTADLAASRPQVDAAAVPARSSGSQAAESAPPIQGGTGSRPQQGAAAPSAAPGPQLDAPPDLSSVPSTGREPAPPSPTVEPQPAAGSPPATAPATSSVVPTPGPVWSTSGQSSWVSGQSIVMTSPQGSYVSGGCETTCGPKCKKHKLCPLKKHKQQVIGSSVVLPSAQSIVSSCEATAPCKVKKPCFLKTWLHHKAGCKNKRCKGCKGCTYCGEPAMMVSAQGPISSGQW